jgi:endo-1,4-beta-xylanase
MSLPQWITRGTYDGNELRTIIKEHIATVVGHFKGRVHSWDVLNEAMAWNPSDNGDGLTKSIWKRIATSPSTTYDYIDQLFIAAHNADPDALLFYNDFAIEKYEGRF